MSGKERIAEIDQQLTKLKAEYQALKRKIEKADPQERSDPLKFQKCTSTQSSDTIADTELGPAPVSKVIVPNDDNYDFENREQELQQYIQLLVHNWATLETNNQVQIAIASQMVGSGKTWFGANIVRSANKYKENLQGLIPEKHKRKFAEFLTAQYIYVDMRKIQPFNARTFLDTLRQMMKEQCISLKLQSSTELKSLSSIALLAQWFKLKLGRPLMFHFDEIDTVASEHAITGFQNKFLQPDRDYIQAYFHFWTLIHSLHPYGYIYCSGRSPLLYLMGKGLYDIVPPSAVMHFFFDRLLQNNVVNMMNKLIASNKLKLKDIRVEDVALLISVVTAGVPRIVFWALNYLQKLEEISADLLDQESFLSSLYRYILEQGGEYELTAWTKLTGDEFSLYTQFVCDAFLVTPYQPDEDQAIKEFSVNTLQVIWALGLYTAKTPQYNEDQSTDNANVYIIVPPLTAYALSKAEHKEVMIYTAMVEVMNSKGLHTKIDLLKQLSSLCLQLRLDSKRNHESQTLLN